MAPHIYITKCSMFMGSRMTPKKLSRTPKLQHAVMQQAKPEGPPSGEICLLTYQQALTLFANRHENLSGGRISENTAEARGRKRRVLRKHVHCNTT